MRKFIRRIPYLRMIVTEPGREILALPPQVHLHVAVGPAPNRSSRVFAHAVVAAGYKADIAQLGAMLAHQLSRGVVVDAQDDDVPGPEQCGYVVRTDVLFNAFQR